MPRLGAGGFVYEIAEIRRDALRRGRQDPEQADSSTGSVAESRVIYAQSTRSRYIDRTLRESDGSYIQNRFSLYDIEANSPSNHIEPFSTHGNPFNPSPWNDGGRVQNSNNCYSYACNDPYNHRRGKPQPGEHSGNPWYLMSPYAPNTITCDSVTRAAVSDGLVKSDCDKECPCNQYKVMLVVDSTGADYHWYRQDSNGMWSGKGGNGPASNVDASGNPIKDPRTADRNYPGVANYDTVCGCFCVPNSGSATGP